MNRTPSSLYVTYQCQSHTCLSLYPAAGIHFCPAGFLCISPSVVPSADGPECWLRTGLMCVCLQSSPHPGELQHQQQSLWTIKAKVKYKPATQMKGILTFSFLFATRLLKPSQCFLYVGSTWAAHPGRLTPSQVGNIQSQSIDQDNCYFIMHTDQQTVSPKYVSITNIIFHECPF